MSEQSDHIENLINQYKQSRSLYKELVKEVRYALQEKLKVTPVKVANLVGRVKKEDSLKDKLNRKKEDRKGLRDMPDLAGVRVVCLYEADLKIVNQIINSGFDVTEQENKADNLGADRMGYHGFHFIVQLNENFKGPRYDNLRGLNCEIQVRTVLQDAWSIISHHLVYKYESSIPDKLKRDLNNVMSLLEIGQEIFDSVNEKRAVYLNEIQILKGKETKEDFLSQPVDYDTLLAYTEWKFRGLPTSDFWTNRLLEDLDRDKYKTLRDIDGAVDKAAPAVEAYKKENPAWFAFSTDYLTKTMGFVDKGFRKRHPFAVRTRAAFDKYANMLKIEQKKR